MTWFILLLIEYSPFRRGTRECSTNSSLDSATIGREMEESGHGLDQDLPGCSAGIDGVSGHLGRMEGREGFETKARI